MIDDVFHNINCAMIPTETMLWSGNSPPQAIFSPFRVAISSETRFSQWLQASQKYTIFPGGLLNSGLLADLESAPKRAGGSADHKVESLPPNLRVALVPKSLIPPQDPTYSNPVFSMTKLCFYSGFLSRVGLY